MSTPDRTQLELWRVFPWDASAKSGARFSPSHVPAPTGRGRFDLPRELSHVLYLAESPEHAVAEMIQPWRGKRIGTAHLVRAMLPLALVRVAVDISGTSIADLCDPEVLLRTGVAPDRSASRRRDATQPLARRVWDGGFAGLRWWSSFWGDWHTCTLFTARAAAGISFDEPERLAMTHAAVTGAAEWLGIELAG
ncbi:MAG: RES family NAD+ phosphorylase [Gemmatimonadetes bacterium]|nr:RES family NAD+ phosphorylase [Gemmatimonadota bacterium]